ncbi:hypothetical protein HGD85_00445 [Rhodobacteraceae bacterium R_SAG10]|jgi:hypothetical protein|nr:hypothetical protein [Rhodobacteraceae bacterium R_SAG10]
MKQGDIRLSGPCALDGGDRFIHAARRLVEAFPSVNWEAGGALDGQLLIRLREIENLPEGAFSISLRKEQSRPVIEITGGPFSGVIYGVEELISRADGDTIALGDAPVTASPGLSYRTFWTWDHSTNWELNQIGQQEIGVFNPYGKPPSGFLADYCRVVDFCSQNRIAAVVIYGFLRDSHGGIAAAQELCHYANERGVLILPGIAIGSYGGVYW